MKRDCHGYVTRDNRVTSHHFRTRDVTAMSRVSHTTTTTPHHTISSVQVSCGVFGYPSIHLTVTYRNGWMSQ